MFENVSGRSASHADTGHRSILLSFLRHSRTVRQLGGPSAQRHGRKLLPGGYGIQNVTPIGFHSGRYTFISCQKMGFNGTAGAIPRASPHWQSRGLDQRRNFTARLPAASPSQRSRRDEQCAQILAARGRWPKSAKHVERRKSDRAFARPFLLQLPFIKPDRKP
jgi:hypothetical protein